MNGGSSSVTHQANKNIVVKSIKEDISFALNYLLIELTILTSIASPYICKPICASYKNLTITMPYYGIPINSKDLKWDEYSMAMLMKQLALALRDLRHHNIVHGDIKHDNVLVDEYGKLTLIDFGVSAIHGTCREYEPYSPEFRYPEIEQTNKGFLYSCNYDVWAMGMMWYYSLHPYDFMIGSCLDITCIVENLPDENIIKPLFSFDLSKILSLRMDIIKDLPKSEIGFGD